MLYIHQQLRTKTESLEKCQQELHKKDTVIKEQSETITKLQNQVANLEVRLSAASTPRSSRQKQCIPRNLELQSDIRVSISTQASEGNKYDHSLPFDHSLNREVTRKVCEGYRKLKRDGCRSSEEEMEQYCKTYFRSVKQDKSRKERGLDDAHRRQARSNKRKRTKFEERQAALKVTGSYTPEELELLELGKFLVDTIGIAGMSSEEDNIDSDDDGINTPTDRRKRKAPQSSEKIRRVRKFYWESPQLSTVKRKMDTIYYEECLKPAQRRRRDVRVKDSSCKTSSRPPPKDAADWMLNDEGKKVSTQ